MVEHLVSLVEHPVALVEHLIGLVEHPVALWFISSRYVVEGANASYTTVLHFAPITRQCVDRREPNTSALLPCRQANIRVWRADTLQTLYTLGAGMFGKAVTALAFAKDSVSCVAVCHWLFLCNNVVDWLLRVPI